MRECEERNAVYVSGVPNAVGGTVVIIGRNLKQRERGNNHGRRATRQNSMQSCIHRPTWRANRRMLRVKCV